jgi:methylmalonyl-CoA/ethylmalonyl-CoA epimerase
MIKGIGHVGIAINNIEETVKRLTEALGLPLPPIKDLPERKMKLAVVSIGGTDIEFLEDYSKDGPLAKMVRERGNVVHHFALLTDQIEADIQALKERGVEMVDPIPKMGLRGKRIAFIEANLLRGIPIELSEP